MTLQTRDWSELSASTSLALHYQVQLGQPDLHRAAVGDQEDPPPGCGASPQSDLTLHNHPEGSRQNLSLITRPSSSEARKDQIL